jgi:hypothetical protein
MQETPEAPAPLNAALGTPDSAAAAAAAMEFATSAAADSLALSGAVLSTGKAASGGGGTAPASQQPPEAAAAQLEAWREVHVLLVLASAWQGLLAACSCYSHFDVINCRDPYLCTPIRHLETLATQMLALNAGGQVPRGQSSGGQGGCCRGPGPTGCPCHASAAGVQRLTRLRQPGGA